MASKNQLELIEGLQKINKKVNELAGRLQFCGESEFTIKAAKGSVFLSTNKNEFHVKMDLPHHKKMEMIQTTLEFLGKGYHDAR